MFSSYQQGFLGLCCLIQSVAAFNPSQYGTTTLGRETSKLGNTTSKLTSLNFIHSFADISSSSAVSLGADYFSSTLVATIGVGTPPQNLNVLFGMPPPPPPQLIPYIDTGSFIFWIRSSDCTRSRNCAGTAFKSSASSTYQNLPPTASSAQTLQYGDGTNVTCTIHADNISMNGAVAIRNQSICMATDIVSTTTDNLDGIVGVGPQASMQNRGQAPFFPTFLNQNPEAESKMSFWYNTNISVPKGGAGEIIIGGTDTSKYTGKINWFPIGSTSNYWSLRLTKVSKADGSVISSITSSSQVIIDTGTTVLLFPPSIAKTLNEQIGATYNPNTDTYTLSCANVASTPPLVFYFSESSTPLYISGNQLAAVQDGVCYSVVQPSDGGSLIIFGAWFLKSFYTIFDYGGNRIGFAAPTGQIQPNVTISISGNSSSSFFGSVSNQTIIIIVLVVALVLGVGTYLYFQRKKSKPAARPGPNSPNTTVTNLEQGYSNAPYPVVPPVPQQPMQQIYANNEIPPQLFVPPPPPPPPQIFQFSPDPVLVRLDPNQEEYKVAQGHFLQWGLGSAPPLISVYKIKMPANLEESFFIKESELSVFGEAELMFSGCAKTCGLGSMTPCACTDLGCQLCSVIRNGYIPENTRRPQSKFGDGVYLSRESGTANDYTFPIPVGDRQVILLNKTLLGYCLKATDSIKLEFLDGTEFQSIHCHPEQCPGVKVEEFIVPTNFVLPVYLIEYEFPGQNSQPLNEVVE